MRVFLEDKYLLKCNDYFPKICEKKKLFLQESHSLNWMVKKLKFSIKSVYTYVFSCRMPLSISFDVLSCVFVIKHNYFHFYNLRFPKRKVVES